MNLLTRTITAAVLLTTTSLWAADEARLDPALDAWKRIPVLHDGRIMPLDTFAREAAEIVCGVESVRLNLDDYYSQDALSGRSYARSVALFPVDDAGRQGAQRKFSAAELLLSWLTEPEKWEETPFLIAEHAEVRELVGVPNEGPDGKKLKYVSPAEAADSQALFDRLRQLQEQRRQAVAQGDTGFQFKGVDRKVQDLWNALSLFRSITYQPNADDSPKPRFAEAASDCFVAWGLPGEEPDLGKARHGVELLMQSAAFAGDEGNENAEAAAEIESLYHEVNDSFRTVAEALQQNAFSAELVEADAAKIAQAAEQIAARLIALKQRFTENPPEIANREALRMNLNLIAAAGRDFARSARLMHLALYEQDDALRVTPALNADALASNRDTTDRSQPWLPLQAVLAAPESLLAGYDAALAEALRPKVAAVRERYAAVRSAVVDRGATDRGRAVGLATTSLSAALRDLGEAIEPARQGLVESQGADPALLAYTAYPAADYTETEVRYHDFNPFVKSWALSLAAFFAFCLAFGAARKPMYWVGLALMAAGVAVTIYGFYLRVLVTQWAPVTNMYETVVYVPLFVSLLAAWLALTPITWDGIKSSWRATAVPFTPEAPKSSQEDAPPAWLNFALLISRGYLMYAVFNVLAQRPYAAGGRTILNLTPTSGGQELTFNNGLTWAVGLCVLGFAVWFVPRAAVTLAASVVAVPLSWIRGSGRRMEQLYARKPFLLAGAFTAFLGSFIAWFSPVLDESFSPLQPVLRDNFWLVIHVLTIVSSYGAGALAWGLGNISLVYYLFGKYQDPAPVAATDALHTPAGPADHAARRRPPAACLDLATYTYRAMQVAVLLLAAGTILGGLWADVSWGRFWGWDPKEVWALISLLVYLAILHGRYAGLIDSFGLAAGAVFGATAIIFSWYGVNFVLGVGLHSYGFGVGGQWEVGSVVAANWLLMLAAWGRYARETARGG